MTNLIAALPQYETPIAEWEAFRARLLELDAEGVSSAIGVQARRILFHLLRHTKPVDILDIGTYVGTSALAFALMAPAARVVTLDIRDQNDSPKSFWRQAGRKQSPRDLMVEAGVGGHVEFVCEDSVSYMQRTSRRFDFISIDGWHEAFHVAKELPLAIGLLKPGGVIFMDDVQPPGCELPPGVSNIPGPYLGIKRALKQRPGLFTLHLIPRSLDGSVNAVALLSRGSEAA